MPRTVEPITVDMQAGRLAQDLERYAQKALDLGATRAAVEGHKRLRIHAPLIRLSKAQIIHQGIGLGVDYGLTSSCYDPGPGGQPCGECDSCLLRARGFAEAGVTDPLVGRFAGIE